MLQDIEESVLPLVASACTGTPSTSASRLCVPKRLLLTRSSSIVTIAHIDLMPRASPKTRSQGKRHEGPAAVAERKRYHGPTSHTHQRLRRKREQAFDDGSEYAEDDLPDVRPPGWTASLERTDCRVNLGDGVCAQTSFPTPHGKEARFALPTRRPMLADLGLARDTRREPVPPPAPPGYHFAGWKGKGSKGVRLWLDERAPFAGLNRALYGLSLDQDYAKHIETCSRGMSTSVDSVIVTHPDLRCDGDDKTIGASLLRTGCMMIMQNGALLISKCLRHSLHGVGHSRCSLSGVLIMPICDRSGCNHDPALPCIRGDNIAWPSKEWRNAFIWRKEENKGIFENFAFNNARLMPGCLDPAMSSGLGDAPADLPTRMIARGKQKATAERVATMSPDLEHDSDDYEPSLSSPLSSPRPSMQNDRPTRIRRSRRATIRDLTSSSSPELGPSSLPSVRAGQRDGPVMLACQREQLAATADERSARSSMQTTAHTDMGAGPPPIPLHSRPRSMWTGQSAATSFASVPASGAANPGPSSLTARSQVIDLTMDDD